MRPSRFRATTLSCTRSKTSCIGELDRVNFPRSAWRAGNRRGLSQLRSGDLRLLQGRQQRSRIEWLPEKAHCAARVRLRKDMGLRARGDKDDWRGAVMIIQPSLQFEAG